VNKIKFGIIGCGLMGREFASAVARWDHLPNSRLRPEIVAICDRFDELGPDLARWYTDFMPSIVQVTSDYRELIANADVEAVYCAVPHHLHRDFYCDVIAADKHLMGEKPFGIDRAANREIVAACRSHPDALVRCSSEFPFFPAVQRIGRMLSERRFGQILEVESGFLHSSDLDPDKPVNWKRVNEFNGEYGCMGDLGMHACHVPFRAGWRPLDVRAVLSNIVPERPDGRGGRVPCLTWDNATLLIRTEQPGTGSTFPWILKTHRIAPGEKNTWYLRIWGTRACARFSTKEPKRFEFLEFAGGEQVWQRVDMGQETAFQSVTGGIFEFGFSDAILQMWAAFIHELDWGEPAAGFAGCVTPEETALSHSLFTAALESDKAGQTVAVAHS
jgi:predicted dehydrogenase